MNLNTTLFQTNHRIFEIVDADFSGDYRNWKLVPLAGKTLAKENTLSGLADGTFLLEGLLVRADGTTEKAYVDVTLPEREIDYHYLLRNGETVRGRGTLTHNAQIIPAVAIEKFGVYDQYYVKGHAEVGVQVLRNGLVAAKVKWPIALDLAYILRDEKRYAEAIEAFTMAIEQREGTSSDYYNYAERAALYTKLNNQEAADRDWEQVRRMAGPEMLRNFRGY